MSDTRTCPSCGTSVLVSDTFCPQCGMKQQEAAEAPSQIPFDETKPNITDIQEVKEETSDIKEKTPDGFSVETKPIEQTIEQKPVEHTPVEHTPVEQTPAEKKPIEQTPDIKVPRQKKFPWFFAVFWFVMVLAAGLWGYFLFFNAGYDYPIFTEDAQRLVLFTSVVALLIYTFSLKLTMRKFKALPTVILVLAALVIFYCFSMVELTDGDFLHDIMIYITNSIMSAGQ